jgi:hypothetical protein
MGTQRSATNRHSIPAKIPKIGVKNPVKMQAPVTMSIPPVNTNSVAGPCQGTQISPCAINVLPTATRKISSPIPWEPAGNAEKSLCRKISVAPQNAPYASRYMTERKTDTRHSGIFS